MLCISTKRIYMGLISSICASLLQIMSDLAMGQLCPVKFEEFPSHTAQRALSRVSFRSAFLPKLPASSRPPSCEPPRRARLSARKEHELAFVINAFGRQLRHVTYRGENSFDTDSTD